MARLEIEEQFYFSRSSGEVGNFETGDFFLGLVLAERIPFITFIVIRVVAAGARTIIYKLHLVSHFGWHVHFQLRRVKILFPISIYLSISPCVNFINPIAEIKVFIK